MAGVARRASLRRIPDKLRGVFAGAGSDGLNEPQICDHVLRLTRKPAAEVTLAYLGTATYDLPGPQRRQTGWFADKGCSIVPVQIGHQEKLDAAAAEAAVSALATADVVLVSGGNTLFAMDRWRASGVADALRQCMERGCVMCGGSAGAICWFDAGHSDSLDPDTFRKAMLNKAAAAAAASSESTADESSAAPASAAEAKPWRYARVGCLGFLPGLVCPHHDKVQSNGVPRADDFDRMLQRHRGEQGICIDHWAALVVDGDTYEVVSLDGKPGSVGGCERGDCDAKAIAAARYVPAQGGIPGAWIKTVSSPTATEGGEAPVASRLVPWSGALADILREPQEIVADPLEAECRAMNPA